MGERHLPRSQPASPSSTLPSPGCTPSGSSCRTKHLCGGTRVKQLYGHFLLCHFVTLSFLFCGGTEKNCRLWNADLKQESVIARAARHCDYYCTQPFRAAVGARSIIAICKSVCRAHPRCVLSARSSRTGAPAIPAPCRRTDTVSLNENSRSGSRLLYKITKIFLVP